MTGKFFNVKNSDSEDIGLYFYNDDLYQRHLDFNETPEQYVTRCLQEIFIVAGGDQEMVNELIPLTGIEQVFTEIIQL